MPDHTVSKSTATMNDTGVSVSLRLSGDDLANLIRYGTVSIDQAPQLHGAGAVHVGRITVDLI